MCKELVYFVSFVLVVGLILTSAAKGADLDLLCWWEFNGNYEDSSGNDHHGTPNGNPVFVEGVFGQALELTGSPQYVNCGPGVSVTTVGDGGTAEGYTISVWINPNNPGGDGKICGDIDSSGWGAGGGFKIALYQTRIEADVRDSSGRFFSRDAAEPEGLALEANTWYHVAVVFDDAGGVYTEYINGEVSRTMSVTQGVAASTGDFRIGTDTPNLGHYYSGLIDDLYIYSRGLTQDEIKLIMATGSLLSPAKASDPSPANEATDVPRDAVLSWTPGQFAAPTNGHKVYFGESYEDVNDATGGVAQDANSYTPAQRLDFGTTYYWRVDEVNAPPTSHIEFKGEVWSFTAEPAGYPIDGSNITATASSSDPGQGPENTVNRSGLDADDLHSTEMTDMWLSNVADANPAWIQYEFDKLYKLHQMWVWNHNTVFEIWVGFGFKDVTIEYSTNGTDWTVLAGVTEFARGTGSPDYAHNTPVDFDGVVAKYVKITANSNWGGYGQSGLSEVRFLYIPVWPREPKPASGATDVALDDVVLSWRAGREAASHDVYLSRKRMAVVNVTVPAITVTEASYDAGTLDLGETYYWKINEVNTAETPTTWDGDVWSFATPEYFVVEDFEDYNDYPPDRIFETWKGGYGYGETEFGPRYCGNGTGSAVGHATEPYAEQTIVHGGSQSMPFYYDNSGTGQNSCGQPINLYYSETERTFDTPQDWTKAGAKALTLYFHGDPDNDAGATEQMYLKVDGAKVVYDGDMADIKQASWQEWNIDLASFGGVNLQNVTKVGIGIGTGTGPGGSGVLYFDDIRLYPARCVPDRKEPPAADLNNDCRVDYLDLEILLNEWLGTGYEITPMNPGAANLVAHYKFDGDGQDSSGEGHHGIVAGTAEWVAGVSGSALRFDGLSTYVDVSDTIVQGSFTLALWLKYDTLRQGGYNAVMHTDGWAAGSVHVHMRTGTRLFNFDVNSGIGATTNTALDASEWYHLVGTFDASERVARVYVDGLLDNTNTSGGTATPSIGSLNIGAWNDNDRFFDGVMDDFRIYDRALSRAEIASLAGHTSTFSEPFDMYQDGTVDFKDYAVLADQWLDEVLWP